MAVTDLQISHVLVDLDRFDIPFPHRSHRLAKFLAAKETTETVVWIYPAKEMDEPWECAHVQNDIYEVPVPSRVPWPLLDKPVVTSCYTNRYYQDNFETVFHEFRSDLNYLWLTKPIAWNLFNFEWDRTIYDCSDHTTSVGWETRSELPLPRYCKRLLGSVLKTQSERRIARAADTVFVSSEFLYDKLEKIIPHDRLFLVETGLDFDLFDGVDETHEVVESIPHPRLGFAGKLKKKIDYELLSDVARWNEGWNIVLIGPIDGTANEAVHRLRRQENVHWIGQVPHAEMPSVLNSLDVGLMPYKDIEYNRGVVPLKLFEYLACELPVVGCCLPSTVKYSKENVYLHTSNDSIEFSHACDTALSWRTGAEERLSVAEGAKWCEKLATIYARTVAEHLTERQNIVDTSGGH